MSFLIHSCKSFAVSDHLKSRTHKHHQMLGFFYDNARLGLYYSCLHFLLVLCLQFWFESYFYCWNYGTAEQPILLLCSPDVYLNSLEIKLKYSVFYAIPQYWLGHKCGQWCDGISLFFSFFFLADLCRVCFGLTGTFHNTFGGKKQMTIYPPRTFHNGIIPWKWYFTYFLSQIPKKLLISFHPLAAIKQFIETDFITVILKSILKAWHINRTNSCWLWFLISSWINWL